MQNQKTNEFDPLNVVEEDHFKKMIEKMETQAENYHTNLVNEKGELIPKHEIVFRVGELIDIKGYTYRVGYIGKSALLLEPIKPTDPIPGVSR